MSTLRECDRHGGSFSTREDGWAEGTLIVHRKYLDGSANDEHIKTDFCAACTTAMLAPVKPSAPGPEMPAIRYDPEYTEWLQKKNGVGVDTPVPYMP
jgi:hypothetical protein